MDSLRFSEHCEENVDISEDCTKASWTDTSSHLFISSKPLTPGAKQFTYRGTGHANIGVIKRTEGCIDWIYRLDLHIRNEHGTGLVKLTDKGILSVIIEGKKDNQRIMQCTDYRNLWLCFDIRFGDIYFHFKGELLSESQNGRVNNNRISLIQKYPGGLCAYDKPLRPNECIEVCSHGMKAAQYWQITMMLSNSAPIDSTNQEFFKLKKFCNVQGTIQVTLTTDGSITYNFKDESVTKKVKKVHLSEDVYLWLKLVRVQVQLASSCVLDTSPIGYIKVNSSAPHAVAHDDCPMTVEEQLSGQSYQLHQRKHEHDEFANCVPSKSARLNPSHSPLDDQETIPKVIDCSEEGARAQLEGLKQRLVLTTQMQQLPENIIFVQMYRGMYQEMQRMLDSINHQLSSDEAAEAQHLLNETFIGLQLEP